MHWNLKPEDAPQGHPSVTELLRAWKGGDNDALEQLTPVVYAELRRMAAAQLRRERAGHTLQPTALLHEAYLRLMAQGSQDWRDRAHFYGVAAHLMRLILVDYARAKKSAKRGAGAAHVSLDESIDSQQARPSMLVDLDEGLKELAEFDPRKASVVEMRFFAGMTIEETAEALGVGVATVVREQRAAEAWLNRYLKGRPAEAPDAGS